MSKKIESSIKMRNRKHNIFIDDCDNRLNKFLGLEALWRVEEHIIKNIFHITQYEIFLNNNS